MSQEENKMRIKISKAPSQDFFFVDAGHVWAGFVDENRNFWSDRKISASRLLAVMEFIVHRWNPKDESTYEEIV